MNINDLFYVEMEPQLNEWIKKFSSPRDLFFSISQLYQKLEKPCISGIVEEGVSIIGIVHIGEGSVIRGQTTIQGPAIIGENVTIHPYTYIQGGTFIGSNCEIKSHSIIKSTMCMNNVQVSSGAVLSNSVLGYGSTVGVRSIIGSPKVKVREDGKQDNDNYLGAIIGDLVNIGAGCVLEANTVIGARSIVTSGAILDGTYPTDTLIRMIPQIKVEPIDRR